MDATNRVIQSGCGFWAVLTCLLQELWESPVFQMLLGAIVSGLVAVFLDFLKRPRLKIFIEEPTLVLKTFDADQNPLEQYKAVRVSVMNTKWWPKSWPRQTLIRARAVITFHSAQTGADLKDRKMRGRWASLPQPEIAVPVNGKRTLWPDPSLIANVPEIDIPWGGAEPLDIAARFEGDSDAFGWSNENYYNSQELKYRPEGWRLPYDQCLVRVAVQGSGEKACEVFRLRKPKDWDLILVPATRVERGMLS
jgi:hypothetical protein